MSGWDLDVAPSLEGKVAVVTGANSGLGFATAAGFRAQGATVLLACRNVQKADDAAQRLVAVGPGPAPLVVRLDLEDLDSVHSGAQEILSLQPRLDFVVNNAGIMGPHGPDSGHRQLWANHLGHVALTALLLDRLEENAGRIVAVSSLMHTRGRLDPKAPLAIEGQAPMTAYGSTKLLNLLFAQEGDRRLRAARKTVSLRAAHPGNARSDLTANGLASGRPPIIEKTVAFFGDKMAQSTVRGALPTLRAALDPTLPSGVFVGPSGPFELWGDPVVVKPSRKASVPGLAAAAFDASLAAVNATWP